MGKNVKPVRRDTEASHDYDGIDKTFYPFIGHSHILLTGPGAGDAAAVHAAPQGLGPTEIPGGAERLPADLLEATRRFRASDKAKELFGPEFVDHFATLCEAEDAALRGVVSPAEVQRYLEAG